MSAIEKIKKAGRSLPYFLTALVLSFSTISITHHRRVSAIGNGWGDPLKPMPFISAGFKSNNCGYPGYGDYVPGRYHLGTDLAGYAGAPVYAIADGMVVDVQFGWPKDAIFIRHTAADGTRFLAVYGHLNGAVPIGTVVNSGQVVGEVGNLGANSHLHLGIRTILEPAPSNNGAASCANWPDENGYVDSLTFLSAHPLAPPPPPPPPPPKAPPAPPPPPPPPPPSAPPSRPQPTPPPPPQKVVSDSVQCREAINRSNESIATRLGITPKCGNNSL